MKLHNFQPQMIPMKTHLLGQINCVGFNQPPQMMHMQQQQQQGLKNLMGNTPIQQSQQQQQGQQQQHQQQQGIPKKVIENYSYQLNDLIGTGYSSKVFKGKDDRNSEEVAVKVIDMKMMNNEVQMFLLQNEIGVMKKLATTQNINILKLSDVFHTVNNTYIITELCNQGDLKDLLKKFQRLDEPQAVKILKHIVNGYHEMAKNRIVHRDIKPANILINDGIPKLADFGFSKDVDSPPYKYNYNAGTPIYMCPESLLKNEYSVKSDIWSIGVLFYELLYGVTPWVAETEKELKYKVSNVSVVFPANRQVSNESKDLILGCLQVDERRRFNLEQIQNHPLMKVNFKKHLEKQPSLESNVSAPAKDSVPKPANTHPALKTAHSMPVETNHYGKENSPPSKQVLATFNQVN